MAMKRISRFIFQDSSSFPRWLSTATETATSVAETATAAKGTASTATQPKRKSLLFNKVSRLKLNPESETSVVADTLDEWVKEGNTIKRFDLINLVSYFRNRKNFRSALQLYDWMESNKFQINNSDQARRIDLLFETKGLASAENYFDTLQESEKTIKTLGAILSTYCKEKVLDKALEIFEKMKESNLVSTINYNNVLSLYYSMEQPEKVISLAQEMEEKNVNFDTYTYNILINSYAALKDLGGVEGVIEKMKINKVECNLFTYGNLATIYVNSGLHDKANEYLEMMEKKTKYPIDDDGFEASRTRWKLYSEMKNLAGVNRAWESLKLTFPTPNNTSYLFMLLALAKMGEIESLEKIYKEWDEGFSNYDFRLPNVVLEFYLSRDMIKEATALYESMVIKGKDPNLKTLSLFATLCLKNGDIDLAMKYLEMGISKAKAKPQNRKWFPADETIKLFLNYFEEKKDVVSAEKFIQKMKKINRLESSVYDSLISKISTEVHAEDQSS